jgi:transposase
LALIVQAELKLDPHSGVTVVFRSKRGDRLKILVWDGSGLVLIYKVLEQGSFAWPKVQDGTMRLSRAQPEALFEGLAPLSANACIRLPGNGRRVMAQRVLPPAAAG